MFVSAFQNSVSLFSQWQQSADPDSDNPVPVDLKSTVYCTAIGEGGSAEWDFLWQRYLSSNNANEKNVILVELGCSNDVDTLQAYLEMTLDPGSGIRRQDGVGIVSGVGRTFTGRDVAWDWLREEWTEISNYFDTAISSSVGSMVVACTADFNTQQDLQELEVQLLKP